jgi:hypothetical protein
MSTIFIFCGCGSLTRHARHQYILVRSNPPGADIYYEGEKLGTTPAFVDIRRQDLNKIKLRFPDQTKEVEIESKYRWDAFWSNFAFVYFAPVGWVVDAITGGSRAMQDPDIAQISTHHAGRDRPRKQLVAIAPPKAYSADLADEAGTIWNERLPLYYKDTTFLPYKSTLGEFSSHGWDYDSRPDRKTEYELFGRTHVDDVFESEFKETDQGVELFGHFRNVYSDVKGKDHRLSAVPWQTKFGQAAPLTERWKTFFRLIPNTVGIELSTSDTTLDTGSGNFQGKPDSDAGGFSKVLPLLSAISITSQLPPRMDRVGHFTFDFVPTLRISYKRIEFPLFTQIQGYEFSYLQLGGGLGPEVGWQWGHNYIYLNYIPIWAWHRLSWSNNDAVHVSSIGRITMRTEFGYLYFISQNFSAKLFGKSTATPPQIWNSAIQDISPGAPQVGSSNDLSAGLMFAFTFTPKRDIRHWAVSSPNEPLQR